MKFLDQESTRDLSDSGIGRKVEVNSNPGLTVHRVENDYLMVNKWIDWRRHITDLGQMAPITGTPLP